MTGNERDGNSMPQGHHLHWALTWDLYLIWIIWSTGPGMHIILILQALGSDRNIQTNSAAQAAKFHVCLRSKEGVFKYWNNWKKNPHFSFDSHVIVLNGSHLHMCLPFHLHMWSDWFDCTVWIKTWPIELQEPEDINANHGVNVPRQT